MSRTGIIALLSIVALLSITFVLENWTNAIYRKHGKVEVLLGLIQADFQGDDHFSLM